MPWYVYNKKSLHRGLLRICALTSLPKVVYLLSSDARGPRHTKNCDPACEGWAAEEEECATSVRRASRCLEKRLARRSLPLSRTLYRARGGEKRNGNRHASFIPLASARARQNAAHERGMACKEWCSEGLKSGIEDLEWEWGRTQNLGWRCEPWRGHRTHACAH